MIDLAAEVVAALRSSSGRDALREALEPVFAAAVRAALEEREEKLERLGAILGLKASSARKRELRDSGLKALGVPAGRHRLYQRRAVLDYLRAKSR